MQHIMIDLETMGTAVNAPVLAIGAVFFNPESGELGERFYRAIDIADACRYGRPSGDTIRFWMKQSDAARQAVIAGTASAEEVFKSFREFVQSGGSDVRPWGNGAGFDISILEHAFGRVLDRPAPWKFWNPLDCRTIKELAVGVTEFKGERAGTHHQALDDAIYQAQWVSHYWQALRGKKAVAAEPVDLL